MNFNLTLMIAAFAAIFITVNPISKVPFFIVLTDGYTREQKKLVIKNAIKVSLGVLIIFAIFGRFLFDVFNVEFLALKFVGAAVLIKIGYDMLMGQVSKFKSTDEERQEAIDKGLVGVVPLGIPMMSGPGAMITTMIYMGEASGPIEWGFIIFAIVITLGITYVLLVESHIIYEKMGKLGITATLRIMGILIASIGVQMMLDNILQFAGMF
ncbi:MAG: MarC family protein [Thermoplasmata archaeon]